MVSSNTPDLIECQHMLTYEAPGPNFQWMDEPYSEEEIMRFYNKEVKVIQGRKKKRKIQNQANENLQSLI